MKAYIRQDPYYTTNRAGDEMFDFVVVRDTGQKISSSYTKKELEILYKELTNFLKGSTDEHIHKHVI